MSKLANYREALLDADSAIENVCLGTLRVGIDELLAATEKLDPADPRFPILVRTSNALREAERMVEEVRDEFAEDLEEAQSADETN